MLADIVDHVIGIDPDRDQITASLVEASTGGELATEAFETTRGGYERLVAWADRHTSRGVEGLGRGGLGQLRVRSVRAPRRGPRAGDRVQPPPHRGDQRRRQDRRPRTPAGRRGRFSDAQTSPFHAPGAAARRCERWRPPAEAPRRRAPRRSTNSKPSSSARLLTCATNSAASPPPPRSPNAPPFRLPAAPLDELTATKQALRSLARRIKTLTAEAADLQTSIRGLVEAVAPHLLDQPGVGPITAAQIYIAWSHPGRWRNEAAFARLAGVAPLEASSGQNTRHRLNRRGDRQLNRALHTIAVTRSRYCPHTQAYIAKRTAEGKTPREAQRCLKRYIARQIYRLLQHPKINT